MSNFSKTELEQMLQLLDLSTLDRINGKYRGNNYTWGQRSLLKYTPEALVEYAAAIYNFVLVPFDATNGLTEDEYIDRWKAPYTTIREQLTAKLVDYITTLRGCVSNPEPLPEPAPEECLYTAIANFLDNNDNTFFTDLIDFLLNINSPLRREEVADTRIIALITEVDAMRDAGNTALDAFIGGHKLKRCKKLVKDRLEFCNLNPKTISTLLAHKDKLPAGDWAIISKVIETRTLTAGDRKVITASLKAIKKGTLAAPASTTAPTTASVMPADEYINSFSAMLESAYSNLKPMSIEAHSDPLNATLDDMYAQLDAYYIAQEQGTPIDNIKAQQVEAQDFFYDYLNIKPALSACLQIILNNSNPASVLTPEALSHGAVQGMLIFVETLKPQLKHHVLRLDYERLAQDLWQEIHAHTKGFAKALPLPEVLFIDKSLAYEPKKTMTVPVTKIEPFDLAPPIQKILSDLGADAVTTDTEHLSADTDLKSLVPVTDATVKNIAEMIAGQGSKPYILDGKLIIQSGDKYIKIIPNVRDDDYLQYVLKPYSWTALTNRIYELQQLLKTADYAVSEDFKYHALPKDPEARKVALESAHNEAELLLGIVNSVFDTNDAEIDKKIAASINKILDIRYYERDPLYISAHRLATWVYYPADYTALITAKPVDAEGNRLYYEPDHKNGDRSNNSRENLGIKIKQANINKRSSSRPVYYNGATYPTLTEYCEKTGAGDYDYIQKTTRNLQPGASIECNNHIYTKDATGKLTATDLPQITYNGTAYITLKDFAGKHNLIYNSLHNALTTARKGNKTKFKHKKFTFYLDDRKNIVNIV